MVVSSADEISVKCKYELPEGEPINYKCRFLPVACVKQFPADWAGAWVARLVSPGPGLGWQQGGPSPPRPLIHETLPMVHKMKMDR